MSPKAKAVLKKCNRKKENDSSVVAVVVVSVVVVVAMHMQNISAEQEAFRF